MLEVETSVEAFFKLVNGTEADPEENTMEGSEDTVGRAVMKSFDSHVENGVNCVIFPFLFLVFNMAVYGSAMDTGYQRGEDSSIDQALDRFKFNSVLAAFCFLVDAVVFYKAVCRVKEEIALFEKHEEGVEEATQETPSTEDAPLSWSMPKYPYANMACKIDAFFLGNSNNSPTTASRVPTLVGLLHALMLSCAAASAACVGVRVYAATSAAQKDCTFSVSNTSPFHGHGIHQTLEAPKVEEEIKIDGIPEGLQSWAVGLSVDGGNVEVPASYIHMSDGRTFFVGRDRGELTDEVTTHVEELLSGETIRSSRGRRRTTSNILMSAQADGSILKHYDVERPELFTVVKGSKDDAEVDTFCCFYNPPQDELWHDDEAAFRRFRKFGMRQTRPVLCVSSNDDQDKHPFRNITGSKDPKPLRKDHWNKNMETLKAFEGELWYVLGWEHIAALNERGRRHHELGGENILEYYKIDPITMEKTMVANVTKDIKNRRDNHNSVMGEFGRDSSMPSCIRWVATITTLVAASVALPGAFWLWRIKGVSAGVAPPTLVGCFMLHAIGWDVLCWFIVVLMPVSAWFIFGNKPCKWLDREALVWAHYSACAYIVVVDWQNGDIDLLAWCIFIGALLNHRTLEIGGLGFGIFFVYMALSDQGPPDRAWILICVGVFLGWGMVSTGRYLNKRHSYFLFSIKRFSQRLRANIPTSGSENDLTQRLVD